jgi:hypothetical protein
LSVISKYFQVNYTELTGVCVYFLCDSADFIFQVFHFHALFSLFVFYCGNFIVFFVNNQLEAELARLHDEQIVLQEKLTKDAEAIETLERLLTTCRKDTLDQKLANQKTLEEVNVLHEKITALQDKL